MSYDDEIIRYDEQALNDTGNDLMPKGRYTAIVSKAEMKQNGSGSKDPSGKHVALEITIQGPTHKGRKVFDRQNVKNTNPEALRIGKRQLAALAAAVGIPPNVDYRPSELCDKLIEVNVGIERSNDDRYPDKNSITSYVKPAVAPQAVPGATQAPAGPPRVSTQQQQAPPAQGGQREFTL